MEAILIESLKVIVPVVVAYVVNLLRTQAKASISASEQARLLDVADMAVHAAEEMYRGQLDKSEDKEAFAVQTILKGFPTMDEATVKAAVKSAVMAMRIAQGK